MEKKLLGILGGMGPLASAEFVKTIYEYNVADLEQEAPACILYSDPSFPDRTDTITNDSDDTFVTLLVRALETLCQLGVSKVVICCMTTHHFLPRLPTSLRNKVISLIDLTIEEILRTKKQHLLLCTNGTRKAGIFQRHDRWGLVERYITVPNNEDQNRVHDLIYQIKGNHIEDSLMSDLGTLLRKYQVDSLIAGCTEIHLLTKKHLVSRESDGQNYRIVDPLLSLAKNLQRYLDEKRALTG